MRVEIWSDILCPYCYIGKRRYEEALGRFEHAASIETVWRSFQLDPGFVWRPGLDAHAYLAERKGRSIEWSRGAHSRLTEAARAAGLTYDFDRAVPANSLDAHRLSHLAREYGVQDAAEEGLFAAYFTEGRDIASHETLIDIGRRLGLEEALVREVLAGNRFMTEVKEDMEEAEAVGVHAVPFFVIDDRYALTGSHSVDDFLRFLRRAWSEWSKGKDNNVTDTADGDGKAETESPVEAGTAALEGQACTIDGVCEPV